MTYYAVRQGQHWEILKPDGTQEGHYYTEVAALRAIDALLSKRYHVQVRVREGGNTYAWRRVRPTGGDPYVWDRDGAEQYIRTQAQAYGHDPANWRLEELPDLPRGQEGPHGIQPEPHKVSQEGPTPENDPAGRLR